MQFKMTKTVQKFALAALALSFVVACNNKKEEEKKEEPAKDTTVAPAPAPAPADTTKMPDSAGTKPVKTPD
jgi:hypothetical protein